MKTHNEQSKSTNINDFALAYQMRKKEWLENFNKHRGTTSKFCKEHGIKGIKRKKPWYVLSKRDSIAI